MGEAFTIRSDLRWKNYSKIANWANGWRLNVVAFWASMVLWVVTVADLIMAIKAYYDSTQEPDAAESEAINEANSEEDKCYENTQTSNIVLEMLELTAVE